MTSSKLLNCFQKGFCLLQDDLASNKRAVLVAPANHITEQILNDLLTYSNGLVFIAIDPKRAEDLQLNRMPGVTSNSETVALVSVDARNNITTGISVPDRLKAIQILASKSPDPTLLVKPGHIFPVEVNPGGTLLKNSLAEGAYDIAQLNGDACAVFLDLLDRHGKFQNDESQIQFANLHKIPIITLSELILHRLTNEKLVYQIASANLPTKQAGQLKSYAFKSILFEGEHIALVKGTIDGSKPVLVRMHSEKTFDDVFGSDQNKSKSALNKAMQIINSSDTGVIVYLRKPEINSLSQQLSISNASQIPQQQMLREYGTGSQILRALGISKIKLISNTRNSLVGLNTFGLEIVGYQDI